MRQGSVQSILLAVFGALIITAVITGYASVKTGELQEWLDRASESVSSIMPDANIDPTGFLLALTGDKEKMVSIEGTLSLGSPISLSFSGDAPLSRLEVSIQKNGGNVRLGNILVGEGVDTLVLENYTGRIDYSGGILELSGKATRVALVVSGRRVPVSATTGPIDIEAGDLFSPGVYLYGVAGKDLFLENATGSLVVSTQGETATITKTNGDVRIRNFTGDLTLSTSSISLKGEGAIRTSLFESKG